MGKAVRLSDIAKRASVSTVTVSKALSGQKGVSESKRVLIERLAHEMGYQKASSASAQKKSYTIGIIVSERFLDGNQSFYWEFCQELTKVASERSNLPALKIVTEKEESSLTVPAMASERQVRGILFLGTFRGKFLKAVTGATKVPYLFLDSEGLGAASDNIRTDNLRMAYDMTNYLFSMGHREIGFVGTRNLTDASSERYLGYLKSILEHGAEYKPEWVMNDRDKRTGVIDPEQFFHIEPSHVPTAYLCCSGISAYLLEKRLAEDGFKVPDDISIAGFEDFVPEKISGTGLTCCRLNIEEAADRAVTLLIRKIEGTGDPVISGTLEIPGTLVIRDSVKRIGKAVAFV